MLAKIKLPDKRFVLIDRQFSHLKEFKWWADSRGYVYGSFRIGKGQKNRRKMLLHHCVIGFPLHGKSVDHINGNPLDNRECNLRIVTSRINNHNKPSYRDGSKTSRFIGVYRRENGKWRASIRINQKLFNLGTFNDEQQAHAIYKERLKEVLKIEGGDQYGKRNSDTRS